jgi:mono/diheme cytochrome c family protein
VLGLTAAKTVPASLFGPHSPNLENGRWMFFAGGCAACHATAGQDDPMRLGGGRELKTKFGTFRVPNISPHARDGIGSWNEAQFAGAMLKGSSPDGRHYYPAFPYTSYQRMRIADTRDLFAFLKTLPAIEGKSLGHDLPFPLSFRAGVGLWKYLYVDGKPFQPDRAKPESWNRGAYLVEGPGHCAECHSARDFLGGIISARRYTGGPNPAGEGSVPDITQQSLARWNEEDFVALLEFGARPQHGDVAGDMRSVVRNTSQLSADDRRAMASYLKSLQPGSGPRN